MRHADVTQLGGLAEAAGFRVETAGDLPLLRYARAVTPGGAIMTECRGES